MTTAHELQVLDEAIPMTEHDVRLDLIVTPERVIRTPRRQPKPAGIFWEKLSEEELAAMPALAKLHRRAHKPSSRRRA